MFHLLTKQAHDAFRQGKARLESDLRESWSTEYLLWGILQQGNNEALHALRQCAPHFNRLKRDVDALLKPSRKKGLPAQLPFDAAMLKTLLHVRDGAKKRVTTLDLLIAMTHEIGLKALFKKYGVTGNALAKAQTNLPKEIEEH